MYFTTNAPMLDFLVLSIIAKEDAYGYQISQLLKKVTNAKDSSLYPILKRLQENGYVSTYDQPYQGRNRKYYRITPGGLQMQETLQKEWLEYQTAVEEIIGKGGKKA